MSVNRATQFMEFASLQHLPHRIASKHNFQSHHKIDRFCRRFLKVVWLQLQAILVPRPILALKSHRSALTPAKMRLGPRFRSDPQNGSKINPKWVQNGSWRALGGSKICSGGLWPLGGLLGASRSPLGPKKILLFGPCRLYKPKSKTCFSQRKILNSSWALLEKSQDSF